MDNKPLKRNPHLIALSHDHHLGLLHSWKIKQGLKNNIVFLRIKNYINFFWENHLKQHFREEETLLFNYLDDELTQRALHEHGLIAGMVSKLNADTAGNDEDYLALAELIIAHIRFEERVLFPHLEIALPPHVLERAGAGLGEQHQTQFKDDYPDEFWIKAKSE